MKMKCKLYQWLYISFFYILCNVMSVKEKEAAAIADIYFSCVINEQSCEAGQKSAKRGFVSEG